MKKGATNIVLNFGNEATKEAGASSGAAGQNKE